MPTPFTHSPPTSLKLQIEANYRRRSEAHPTAPSKTTEKRKIRENEANNKYERGEEGGPDYHARHCGLTERRSRERLCDFGVNLILEWFTMHLHYIFNGKI